MPVRVKFWGTRGSIPVAFDAASLKDRIARALVAASGRKLQTLEQARAWIEHDLDFALGHTFGGDSPCVQLDAGTREYVLCDLGTGARVFGARVLSLHGAATPQVFHVFMSHLH